MTSAGPEPLGGDRERSTERGSPQVLGAVQEIVSRTGAETSQPL